MTMQSSPAVRMPVSMSATTTVSLSPLARALAAALAAAPGLMSEAMTCAPACASARPMMPLPQPMSSTRRPAQGPGPSGDSSQSTKVAELSVGPGGKTPGSMRRRSEPMRQCWICWLARARRRCSHGDTARRTGPRNSRTQKPAGASPQRPRLDVMAPPLMPPPQGCAGATTCPGATATPQRDAAAPADRTASTPSSQHGCG